ncbi:hypothetical protein IID04_07085 [PVC group bacterium]|nr:hypothetical protein [PVC group bacterium]MCH7589993.1 hypothetical protein [PVC group bacterium]
MFFRKFDNLKTVFRFDVGARGFMAMIYTLIVTAMLLLVLGACFFWSIYHAK